MDNSIYEEAFRNASNQYAAEQRQKEKEDLAKWQSEGGWLDIPADMGRGLAAGAEGFVKSLGSLADHAAEAWGGDLFEDDVLDPKIHTRSFLGGLTKGATQFALGMIPVAGVAGKLGLTAKAAQAGRAAALGLDMAEGAVVDFYAFDEHEGRLSDLIQEYPSLANPVTEFLRTDANDGWAESRLKNVLEGAGMGAIFHMLHPALSSLKKGIKAKLIGEDASEAVVKSILERKPEIMKSEVMQGFRQKLLDNSDISHDQADAVVNMWFNVAKNIGEDPEDYIRKRVEVASADPSVIESLRKDAFATGEMLDGTQAPLFQTAPKAPASVEGMTKQQLLDHINDPANGFDTTRFKEGQGKRVIIEEMDRQLADTRLAERKATALEASQQHTLTKQAEAKAKALSAEDAAAKAKADEILAKADELQAQRLKAQEADTAAKQTNPSFTTRPEAEQAAQEYGGYVSKKYWVFVDDKPAYAFRDPEEAARVAFDLQGTDRSVKVDTRYEIDAYPPAVEPKPNAADAPVKPVEKTTKPAGRSGRGEQGTAWSCLSHHATGDPDSVHADLSRRPDRRGCQGCCQVPRQLQGDHVPLQVQVRLLHGRARELPYLEAVRHERGEPVRLGEGAGPEGGQRSGDLGPQRRGAGSPPVRALAGRWRGTV